MKTVPFAKLSLAAILCLSAFTLPAQFKLSNVELGADINNFIYQGDLTPPKIGSLKTMTWGLDIYGSYKLNSKFSLKTQLLFGSLKGDESRYSKPAYRQQRNFAFTTPVTEISENIVWNIVPPATQGGARLTPYLSAGVGYAFLHIRRDYSRFNAAYFGPESFVTIGLGVDTMHSVPGGLLVLPVSAGLRYALTNKWSLNLETTYRLNSSDYLDGFSQSANTERKDHFFTNAIGVIYTFGKASNMLKCPTVK